jgi:hypothetical protein
LTKQQVKSYLDYIQAIYKEYAEFRTQEDNLVLFGSTLELEDIKRCAQRALGEDLNATQMQTPFVILPITRNDFQKLSDPVFLQLLACFGVEVRGQIYPRVDSSV